MKIRLSENKTKIYFTTICLIAILFIFSPLIIQIPWVYEIIRNYLSIFNSIDYKNTYIQTVGAILGTFLAITGAIWTQSILNKYEKTKEIEKNALIVYYDFKFSLDSIVEIFKIIYPQAKSNILPDDEIIIDKFRKKKRKHCIFID